MIVRSFALALASLRFRGLRSALTALGIGLATALAATTLGFRVGYEEALERDVDAMGYQVLVTGKGCPHEAATLILRGGSIPMYIQQGVAEHIVSQPEVRDATRFFMQSVSSEDGRSAQLYVGVDERFAELRPGIALQRGAWFSSAVADEVVLGYNVAEYRRLELGDSLVVQGRSLTVRGVLDKLGTQDDGTVFLPLATAQDLFERRDRLTGIGLQLHDIGAAGTLIDRLYELPSVQVVRMAQVQATILGILTSVEGLLFAFGGLCLLVAWLGVLNAALLSAYERRGEMGVLRAIGCSTPRLFLMAWAESILLAAIGVVAGLALTFAMRGGFEAFVRDTLAFVPAGPVVALRPGILASCGMAVLALCVLAGVVPALRSARQTPMTTIRGGDS